MAVLVGQRHPASSIAGCKVIDRVNECQAILIAGRAAEHACRPDIIGRRRQIDDEAGWKEIRPFVPGPSPLVDEDVREGRCRVPDIG